jgi:hypothetical protein
MKEARLRAAVQVAEVKVKVGDKFFDPVDGVWWVILGFRPCDPEWCAVDGPDVHCKPLSQLPKSSIWHVYREKDGTAYWTAHGVAWTLAKGAARGRFHQKSQ